MALPTPAYSSVAETDWAEAWKAHYKPLRIGKRILVRPLWIEANLQPGDIEIALDPGMAFGTGTHATTQLCLQALEDRLSPGMTVLDLGTGSGILAIAAAKLGAAHVYAIDNDPVATEAAAGNFAQNGANEAVTIATGSLADALGSGTAYDFVVVNILARIILGMTGDGLERVVKPGGIAVFSGIIQPQADEVEAALRAIGLKPTARRQRDDWVLIETTRV